MGVCTVTVAVRLLVEDVPICVDAGSSKLIADLESSTSCSQLKVWRFQYNLLYLSTYTISSSISVQGSLPVYLSASLLLLLLFAGLVKKLNSDYCVIPVKNTELRGYKITSAQYPATMGDVLRYTRRKVASSAHAQPTAISSNVA